MIATLVVIPLLVVFKKAPGGGEATLRIPFSKIIDRFLQQTRYETAVPTPSMNVRIWRISLI
jgi:hypothetical protein